MGISVAKIPNIQRLFPGSEIPASYRPDEDTLRGRLIKELDQVIGTGTIPGKKTAARILSEASVAMTDSSRGWFIQTAQQLGERAKAVLLPHIAKLYSGTEMPKLFIPETGPGPALIKQLDERLGQTNRPITDKGATEIFERASLDKTDPSYHGIRGWLIQATLELQRRFHEVQTSLAKRREPVKVQ